MPHVHVCVCVQTGKSVILTASAWDALETVDSYRVGLTAQHSHCMQKDNACTK